MSDKEIVKVRMFGDFEITFRGVVYNVRGLLSNQLTNLLQYLIINHNKEIFNDELYDALMSESKNPQNTLKFTVFRLREALRNLFHDDSIEWIETKKGGYRLTHQFEYDIDTDKLTNLANVLENKVEFNRQDYKTAIKVMDIYKGHLSMTSSQLLWISQLAEWYCGCFVSIVGRICKYLISLGNYEKMIELDYQAILREPFYEGLHYFYIQGLIETKEYHKALKYYDEINAAFYKELGVGLSSKFEELYNIIEVDKNSKKALPIKEIKTQLVDIEYPKNNNKAVGYYCTFDLFKHIYEVLGKAAQRDEKKYYLILLSLVSQQPLDKKTIVFNRLRDIILSSIRSSDLCAKVNDTQFVLLTPCIELENTYLIIKRITDQFYRNYPSKMYRIEYDIEDLTEESKYIKIS